MTSNLQQTSAVMVHNLCYLNHKISSPDTDLAPKLLSWCVFCTAGDCDVDFITMKSSEIYKGFDREKSLG